MTDESSYVEKNGIGFDGNNYYYDGTAYSTYDEAKNAQNVAEDRKF